MRDGMAETIAEAEAQQFTLPTFRDRREFAGLLDGYMIAKEMGVELGEWYEEHVQHFRQTGEWNLTLLELRVVLFYTYRSDRWTGFTHDEHDSEADSLLHAISEKTGLPYVAPNAP